MSFIDNYKSGNYVNSSFETDRSNNEEQIINLTQQLKSTDMKFSENKQKLTQKTTHLKQLSFRKGDDKKKTTEMLMKKLDSIRVVRNQSGTLTKSP